jgi:hypothetical protein
VPKISPLETNYSSLFFVCLLSQNLRRQAQACEMLDMALEMSSTPDGRREVPSLDDTEFMTDRERPDIHRVGRS